MKTERKQTAKEKLAIVLAQAEVAEAYEAVSAMSAEELEKELADAGIDAENGPGATRLRAMFEGGEAEGAKEGEEAEKVVVPLRARRARARAPWVALAVAAAVLAAVAWEASKRETQPEGPMARPDPSSGASPPPAPSGSDIRGNPIQEQPQAFMAGHARCTPLDWADAGAGDGDSVDGLDAARTTLEGSIASVEGTNANGAKERFFVLELVTPVCARDGSAVDEVQIYADDVKLDLGKLTKRAVRVEGVPFEAHTAHHHRPIVVTVEKVVIR